ncbi:hypothetical protein J3459_010397 [Metarhizium acridum]|uniref:uncharacterized protein n=1 Tax=Metarhizium acridum TaxID=92637 RepID=UPI001C6C578D|nr:hypothetical protein J3458_020686 [Metarhizium acridum]KAG8422419.1 hypothetical protein J3459_010397 [Metarhizium acridum]
MQLLAVLALASVSSASAALQAGSSAALTALRNVCERQMELCKPVPAPYTCERSCGVGFVECISFPTCYDPGRGDSCCPSGKTCPTGLYCTNAGCCENGQSLEECGDTISLSVLPPQRIKASTRPAQTTSTPTSIPSEPATTSETELASAPPASSTAVGTLTGTTPSANGTASATSPPIVTAGAGRNAAVALGDLGAVLLAI